MVVIISTMFTESVMLGTSISVRFVGPSQCHKYFRFGTQYVSLTAFHNLNLPFEYFTVATIKIANIPIHANKHELEVSS